MPNNPREKREAFDFVPGSVNVPIPLTPSQGKREWEEEEEGALVYRYVKGIRWEKGTLTLSLSLPRRPKRGKEFEHLEVNSNFLPARSHTAFQLARSTESEPASSFESFPRAPTLLGPPCADWGRSIGRSLFRSDDKRTLSA